MEHHGNVLNASVIMFPWLPKHQDLQKSFPKPASQLNKTHGVTGLQLTALNGVQLERRKIGKALHCTAAVAHEPRPFVTDIPLSLLCSESAGKRESGNSLGKVRPAYLGLFST